MRASKPITSFVQPQPNISARTKNKISRLPEPLGDKSASHSSRHTVQTMSVMTQGSQGM